MPPLTLPIITPNPAVDYRQDKLIEQLEAFFSAQNQTPPAKLPFDSLNGLCSGLVSYWLYSKRIGEEGKFLHKLEYVLTHSDPNDQKIAEFVNTIMFLHHDKRLRYREKVNQDSLSSSFKLLLGEHHAQVNEPEFKVIFVFNHATLTQLILDYVFANKMIRLDNGMHTLGLIYSGEKYYLYDLDSTSGPQEFSSADALATGIFASLAKYCHSKDYIALYMAVFDIDDEKPAPYQDINCKEYCRKLLANPEYKQAVLTHENIFHLGLRFNNDDILNTLFDNGYKYIPWTLNPTTEYEEAVICQDEEKLNYLLKQNIPIDYRAPEGTTALARAIINNLPNMMYALLVAGASPNAQANAKKSLLDVALLYENSSAIILLLAAGMELSKSDIKELCDKYTLVEMEAIITHALALHTKLNSETKPVTNELLQSMDDIISAITSKELKLRSQEELDDIKIILQTLQDIASYNSDVSERAKIARDKIANYLHVPIPPALIFRAAKSYEEDVAPLLSLQLKI